MKYFWNPSSGLNAEIERHRAEEKRLIDLINAINGEDDPMTNAARKAYFRILGQLQQSKAEVLTKFGKK